MSSLYSNGPNKDFVIRPYQKLIAESNSPFVTLTKELATAATQGKSICLLVGLNVATSPRSTSRSFRDCESRRSLLHA